MNTSRQQFINYDIFDYLYAQSFKSKEQFVWANFQQFLTEEGFSILYQEFPSLNLFEKHQGIKRVYGQRPHNRYYLAYEHSTYSQLAHPGKGVVKLNSLPESWKIFIEELENSKEYINFIKFFLGIKSFKARYVWHIGVTNSEVSPHVDTLEKIGTHIFYFNTSQDWDGDWGGSTLVLEGKLIDAMNPEFTDFTSVTSTQILDNHSFIFKNTPNAWHGVKRLSCPEGKYRKIFKVVIEKVSNN